MTLVADPLKLKHRPDASLASVNVDGLHPNMSPSVFRTLQDRIAGISTPRIVEIGIGISTYHLCKQLMEKGGTYLGIEHNRSWFGIVEAWIARLLAGRAKQAPVEQRRIVGPLRPKHYPNPLLYVDSTFQTGPLTVTLLLRQAASQTGDGTAEEFHEYLEAVAGPADVIVVDGRARVPALKRIAETSVLAPGGILFLHDAKGYKDQVSSLFPGGVLLEGRGGFKNALRPEQIAVNVVPEEAYLWQAPVENGEQDG